MSSPSPITCRPRLLPRACAPLTRDQDGCSHCGAWHAPVQATRPGCKVCCACGKTPGEGASRVTPAGGRTPPGLLCWPSTPWRVRGCSSMAELLLPKQTARVRFPSAPPLFDPRNPVPTVRRRTQKPHRRRAAEPPGRHPARVASAPSCAGWCCWCQHDRSGIEAGGPHRSRSGYCPRTPPPTELPAPRKLLANVAPPARADTGPTRPRRRRRTSCGAGPGRARACA